MSHECTMSKKCRRASSTLYKPKLKSFTVLFYLIFKLFLTQFDKIVKLSVNVFLIFCRVFNTLVTNTALCVKQLHNRRNDTEMKLKIQQ